MRRFPALTLFALAPLLATTSTTPSVTVSPSAYTLTLAATKTFYASVSGFTDKTVTWQVNGIAGGNATVGTIAADGKYTAPSAMPAPNVVTVKAVSKADATKSGTASITLHNPVPYIYGLSPNKVNIGLAETVTITGKNFVKLSSIKLDGATAPTTYVSSTELRFTANGSGAPRVIYVTVANPDPGASVSSAKSFSVVERVAVSVSPSLKTLRGGASYDFNSYVSNHSNKTVDWFVNGIKGGNSTVGAVDANGVYTAPLLLPAGASIVLKAVSLADPSASATASVTLLNPIPTITSATPGAVAPGAVRLTLNGTGFASGAQVYFGGKPWRTTWLSTGRIEADGEAAALPGGVAAIKVLNPDPGTSTSNTIAVPVRPAVELISRSAAIRFLQQASWGASPQAIAELQEIGIPVWLDRQLAEPATGFADPADTSMGLSTMQKAFFRNAFQGRDQLRQRAAFALGQIFVVSGSEVSTYFKMIDYQRLLLRHAFGNYFDLLRDVTLSPAMGIYLDMVDNAKPDPIKGTVPNENYAREVLQLFSIGLVQLNPDGVPARDAAGNTIPTYNEDTVKGFTLAFTGWTFPPQPGFLSKWKNPSYFYGQMVPFDNYHDMTEKRLLNGAILPPGRTASEDLDAALGNIFNHPNVAPFISFRLIQRLVTSNPSPAYTGRIAAVFNNNGQGVRGDLKAVLRAILLDPEAGNALTGAEPALPANQGHLREPVLFAAHLLRALGAQTTTEPSLNYQTSLMGQNLFYPPSVFNYFSPFARVPGTPLYGPEFQILNPSTALARINFVHAAVRNGISSTVTIDTSNMEDLAGDPLLLTDAVDQALTGGRLPAEARSAIVSALQATTHPRTRVRNALYLAACAGQYQVQR